MLFFKAVLEDSALGCDPLNGVSFCLSDRKHTNSFLFLFCRHFKYGRHTLTAGGVLLVGQEEGNTAGGPEEKG